MLQPDRTSLLALALAGLAALATACGGAVQPTPETAAEPPVVIPAEVTVAAADEAPPQEPAPEEPADPAAALKAAIEAKDYTALEGMMTPSFGFGLIASEGLTLTPAEMVAQLQESYLGPGNVSVDLERDVASEVGPDYQNLVNSYARSVYSSGWGDTQADSALLFLDEQGAWTGMLYMFEGLEEQLFAGAGTVADDTGEQPPGDDETGETPEPVEGAVYTALGPFQDDLLEGITTNRDYGLLQSLMGDPFTIGYWQSEGVTLSPPAAAQELQANLLPPEAFVSYTLTDDLTGLLGGQDPLSLFGPDVEAVRAIHSTGWGHDGEGEAIIVIARRPDNSYYWHGIIFAGAGF